MLGRLLFLWHKMGVRKGYIGSVILDSDYSIEPYNKSLVTYTSANFLYLSTFLSQFPASLFIHSLVFFLHNLTLFNSSLDFFFQMCKLILQTRYMENDQNNLNHTLFFWANTFKLIFWDTEMILLSLNVLNERPCIPFVFLFKLFIICLVHLTPHSFIS